jgi:hypothetical protein
MRNRVREKGRKRREAGWKLNKNCIDFDFREYYVHYSHVIEPTVYGNKIIKIYAI